MFFAPAIRSETMLPEPAGLDFRRFMNEAFSRFGAGWSDLQEGDDAWTLSIDVPGIAKEHLAVQVEGRTVRIESSHEAKRQFKASYELPEEIDPEGSSASLESGVLTLKLVKAHPVQRRHIAIQ